MLKIHNNPPRREWPALTARCTQQEGEITERVAAILSQVRTGGDKALRDLVGPHRRLRPREVRGFPQAAHRSGQSRAATAQDGACDRQVQYRSLPQGPALAAGRHRSDARRAVRAACRSHRPRGALRPGRQCPALLDGADARPPRPRSPGCGEVVLCTPARPGGTIRPRGPLSPPTCAASTASSPSAGRRPWRPWPTARRASRASTRSSVPATAYVTTRQAAGRRRRPWPSTCPPGPSEVLVLADDEAPARPSPPPTCCRRPSTEDDSQAVLVCPYGGRFARQATQRAVERAAARQLQPRRGHPRGTAPAAASWSLDEPRYKHDRASPTPTPPST